MWMLQIAFIEPYYEQTRSRSIYNITSDIEIAMKYENFFDNNKSLEQSIGKESLCTTVFNSASRKLVSVNALGDTCSLNQLSKYAIEQFIAHTKTAANGDFSFKFTNTNLNKGMYLYTRQVRVNDSIYYIFVNSPVELLDSTVNVLKRQFGLLTLLVFSVATLIALVLSRRLAHPIIHLTQSARKLALGDYGTGFEGTGYQEVQELAETLNYATSEFKKTDELRRDLVANVSHDIKTPLTMIKAYAEMIQDISGDNPEMRNTHLRVIVEETNRLERLINDMLTLSKYESEVFNIKESRFNLRRHIDNTVNLFQVLDVDFRVQVDRDIFVFADEIKMGQVLYNYINNATKFVGKDNTIRIKASLQKDEVIVSVEDRGAGIEKDVLDHIWDRYYKIDKNYTRSDSSSGLGLAIVKAICDATSSRYWVESELGKGSIFYYTLKLAKIKETV